MAISWRNSESQVARTVNLNVQQSILETNFYNSECRALGGKIQVVIYLYYSKTHKMFLPVFFIKLSMYY
jgi:hypothetical protein